MKKSRLTFLAAVIALFFIGCSSHSGYIGHKMTTNVQLNSNNFKVIQTVTGEATSDYVFGIGPAKDNLFDQAKRNMLNKADLAGSAKAVINITTDVKTSWFLIWRQKKVYVSGDVVEFINK